MSRNTQLTRMSILYRAHIGLCCKMLRHASAIFFEMLEVTLNSLHVLYGRGAFCNEGLTNVRPNTVFLDAGITVGIKGAWSFLFSFFSKLLRFWYHKNRHIFLIIILKFHALIPLRLEENCKNSPILLIWW